jgi:hypothetical protein
LGNISTCSEDGGTDSRSDDSKSDANQYAFDWVGSFGLDNSGCSGFDGLSLNDVHGVPFGWGYLLIITPVILARISDQ